MNLCRSVGVLTIVLLLLSSTRLVEAALLSIPAPANAWASSYLYVLDKDTNGMFVNANALFIASLKPQFPEIQSVSNLTGKDDFYFYPKDLAEKFRADDRRVIQGGTWFATTEINEPIGGLRTSVTVTKVPLRDSQDRIIGLRAVWHSHPQVGGKLLADRTLEVSFPSDAGPFRLETSSNLGLASWSPADTRTIFLGPPLSIHSPTTNKQSYFRMTAEQPVKIGALLSLTGEWSTLGNNCNALFKAGMEGLNLDQLSSGSPLRFSVDVRDTKLIPEVALAQLQSLAEAGVKIVLGPQSSAEARLLKPYADANGIVLVSMGSTASSLSIPNDNLFRFCPDDTYEGEAIVTLMKHDGLKAIVPAWRDDAGNQGLHDSTERLFKAAGGSVSPGVMYGVNETNWTKVAADISAQVAAAKVQNGNNVGVYLAAFDEAAKLFEAARLDPTLSNVQWYGSDGVVQSAVLASNSVAAQFAMTHWYPCPTFGLDPRYTASWEPLFTLIKTRTGAEVDAFAVAGFDALQVAAAAYKTVGGNVAFADIKEAFLQIANDYVGASGPTKLNPAGDRAGGAFDFWVLRTAPTGAFWKVTGAYTPDPAGGSGTILLYP